LFFGSSFLTLFFARALFVMRLFIAIPLADAAARELEQLVARLRPSAAHLRFTARESWHVTLQFLGDSTANQLDCLASRLARIDSAPFPLRIGELGFFDRSGVLFVDVAVTPALVNLQQRVVAAAAHCGFAAEQRPYRPHITIARSRGRSVARIRKSDSSLLQSKLRSQPQISSFTAREFLLFESHISSDGSRYEVRARFPLGPRAGYTHDDESDR
jgi:RNA 2',3'-cyclic 3'-phosphodiesterase